MALYLGDSTPAISGVSRRQCELQVLDMLGALGGLLLELR